MARRFSHGGAGFNIPKNPRRSTVLYGHMINPNKLDDEPMVINDKMIHDHIRTFRQLKTTKSQYMQSMQELSENPNIQWKDENSKAAFLRDCEHLWTLAAA